MLDEYQPEQKSDFEKFLEDIDAILSHDANLGISHKAAQKLLAMVRLMLPPPTEECHCGMNTCLFSNLDKIARGEK